MISSIANVIAVFDNHAVERSTNGDNVFFAAGRISHFLIHRNTVNNGKFRDYVRIGTRSVQWNNTGVIS